MKRNTIQKKAQVEKKVVAVAIAAVAVLTQTKMEKNQLKLNHKNPQINLN